jgi:hypothetical protein
MKRFVEACNRTQSVLLPECLEDFVSEANPVRVIDVFVDELFDSLDAGVTCCVRPVQGAGVDCSGGSLA